MNTIELCVLSPIIPALSYGLTHLMWTAIGVRLPGPKRRALSRLKKSDERQIASNAPIVAFTRGRVARTRYFAALPQEARHGIGSHLDN